MYDKIVKASELIHKSSIKGSGNYIVTSPTVADMIQEVYNKEKASWRKEKIKKIFNV